MFQTGFRPLRRMFLVPLVYAVAGVVVAFLLPRLEARLFPALTLGLSLGSAQVILSTIASGMMALTAIVFSVAFVMVQFSATAYSPRLVMWLARSPVINHSIGVFTATFLYAIGAGPSSTTSCASTRASAATSRTRTISATRWSRTGRASACRAPTARTSSSSSA